MHLQISHGDLVTQQTEKCFPGPSGQTDAAVFVFSSCLLLQFHPTQCKHQPSSTVEVEVSRQDEDWHSFRERNTFPWILHQHNFGATCEKGVTAFWQLGLFWKLHRIRRCTVADFLRKEPTTLDSGSGPPFLNNTQNYSSCQNDVPPFSRGAPELRNLLSKVKSTSALSTVKPRSFVTI